MYTYSDIPHLCKVTTVLVHWVRKGVLTRQMDRQRGWFLYSPQNKLFAGTESGGGVFVLIILNMEAYYFDILSRSVIRPINDGIIAIWERASVSLFMLSALQGNYLYHIFIVFGMFWSWLGIEPGTFHTLSHQSTTRLSSVQFVIYRAVLLPFVCEGDTGLWPKCILCTQSFR